MGYELIAGVSPFGKDFKPNNVLDRVTMEIPPLHKAVPGCPVDLSRIIEKAMSMKLSSRYQSAADLKNDLERFERGESLALPPLGGGDWDEENEAASQETPKEVPTWESNKPQNLEQPLVNSTQGFLSSHLKDLAPATREKRRIPLFAAVLLLACLLTALGFTSALIFRKPNPLQGLPNGVYTGTVTGIGGAGAQIPLGVWAFPDHALALLGMDGCAAGTLPSNGSYQCGDHTFRFSVSSVSPDGASGSVSAVESGETGTWVISHPVVAPKRVNSPAPAVAPPTQPAPVTAPAAAAPVAKEVQAAALSRPAEERVDTSHLQEIEQQLKDGKISPEEAARALLSMTDNPGGTKR